MATRERQALAADAKAAKAAALKTLTGEPLPLPTDPRTTPATFTDDLPSEVIALGNAGLTDTQIANHLNLSADELKGMADRHSSLRDGLSRARTAAKAWWEEQARRALITENNRFPAGAWAQVMKARFLDYDDRPSITLDLGSLVVIQRARPEQLTGSQSGSDAKPLIEGRTVRLHGSQTVETGAGSNLSSDTAGEPQSPGVTGRGEGG